jgi:hypothetical protein
VWCESLKAMIWLFVTYRYIRNAKTGVSRWGWCCLTGRWDVIYRIFTVEKNVIFMINLFANLIYIYYIFLMYSYNNFLCCIEYLQVILSKICEFSVSSICWENFDCFICSASIYIFVLFDFKGFITSAYTSSAHESWNMLLFLTDSESNVLYFNVFLIQLMSLKIVF